MSAPSGVHAYLDEVVKKARETRSVAILVLWPRDLGVGHAASMWQESFLSSPGGDFVVGRSVGSAFRNLADLAEALEREAVLERKAEERGGAEGV